MSEFINPQNIFLNPIELKNIFSLFTFLTFKILYNIYHNVLTPLQQCSSYGSMLHYSPQTTLLQRYLLTF